MLGRAGTMKLPAARKAAWEALQQMQRGLNPNHEKRKLVVDTFKALAEMYMTEELPQKRQGHQVARWLRSLDVAGVILKYRIAPRYRHPAPLEDAQRALRFTRAHARSWARGKR